MSIVIEHLNYVYMQGGPYETKALDDVSLTIHDGEFVGLIGHTGSGKSTLVQHLNGLILPTSGQITVDGMDLADKNTDKRAIRRRVGLVFQYPENQLFEETVAKDIAFGPKNLGLDEAEIDRRVRYLTKCMENLKIVDYSPQQEGKVFFGAWVEIENDDGVTHRFRIVGYDEIFGRKDYISIDSPMARALLKKEVGDLAVVNTPAGEASWYVNAIEYVKP